MTDGLTARAAELVGSIEFDSLSAGARSTVRRALVDYTACLAAGLDTPQSRILACRVRREGGLGEVPAAGSQVRVPASRAALVNGTAAHAIDFDDVNSRMFHPSVVLAPATLALASVTGAAGEDVVSGYVAGFEVAARLCSVLNPPHYNLGWHATATVGTLGAAAAAARVLRLDAKKTAIALGIAASMAGGIRRNFGSMVKPLHAGLAGERGVEAARWAEAGLDAHTDVLSGPNGFLDVFAAEGTSVDDSLFAPGTMEIEESGIAFKRYACCGAIHAALDLLLEQRSEYSIDPDRVTSIKCDVNSYALDILQHAKATTPDEGRFSMQYSLAVAMVDGRAGPAQYTESRVADPRVVDLMARVEVNVDESLPTGQAIFPATLTVYLDGKPLPTQTRVRPAGYPDAPFADSVLDDKLLDSWTPYVGAEDADALDRLINDVANWRSPVEYDDFILRLTVDGVEEGRDAVG